jgi:hypothetical protein
MIQSLGSQHCCTCVYSLGKGSGCTCSVCRHYHWGGLGELSCRNIMEKALTHEVLCHIGNEWDHLDFYIWYLEVSRLMLMQSSYLLYFHAQVEAANNWIRFVEDHNSIACCLVRIWSDMVTAQLGQITTEVLGVRQGNLYTWMQGMNTKEIIQESRQRRPKTGRVKWLP